MLLHPDRYSTTTLTRKNGVVVHDSEGGEGIVFGTTTASAQLVAALQAPGDRPSPSRPGAYYGAGYHAVATEAGSYVAVADATAAPYHAPPCNPTWWAICIPGKAAQTRDQWLDTASRQYIHGVARYIVDRWNEDGRSWPLTLVNAAQLKATDAHLTGHPTGYTAHAQVSLAWKLTDHTDPGAAFPWDMLADDIASLVHSSPEDPDMAKVVKPYDGPDIAHLDNALLDTASFALTGGIATWIGDLGALHVQQAVGTIPSGNPTPVKRDVLKAYRLVGPAPPVGYGYAVHPTTKADFAPD